MLEYMTENQACDCGTIDVAVIGDALIDYLYWVQEMPPVGGDTMISQSSKSTGGSAANSAIDLGVLHIRTAFCGRVGSDDNGQWIKDKMEAAGVDTSCMQYGESTGYVLSIIDKNSERTMFSFRGASADPLIFTPIMLQTIQSARLLLLSGYSLMQPEQAALTLLAAKAARGTGGLVALDPSPVIGQINPEILAQILDAVDIIMPNKTELQLLTGIENVTEAIDTLLPRVPCIALKLGSEGSMAVIREGFTSPGGITFITNAVFHAPAGHVTPVDTTGAGDAFNAGFIAAMLQCAQPQKWIEGGNELAAKVVARKGACL